jgi:UDP-N-acetyl-2-amino-2-deoxyglucuronate dehydrogenase
MVEKLRFGLVGCGVVAPLHAEAITSLPDAYLAAVADVVPEQAEKLAARYRTRAYSDLQVMLAREHLDVVSVCVPSGMHGEHACRAMRAGCHVIIEKPVEIRLEAIDEMLQVQQEQGVKLAVISQHRFDPATQQVKALIDEGALGRLVLATVQVPWWRTQTYYESGDWRGTRHLDGGGVLMNQAIHSLDLLQWLVGPVRSVSAYIDTLVHRMETEDVAVAVLRFASGALGTLSATTGGYPGLAARLEFLGDRGSAVIEGDELAYLHLARTEQKASGAYGISARTGIRGDETSVARSPAAQSAASHALQIADMIRAIRENGTPLVDGYAARRPVEIILGIYESSRTSREVVLP